MSATLRPRVASTDQYVSNQPSLGLSVTSTSQEDDRVLSRTSGVTADITSVLAVEQ
jgi:hypothetical protein